MLRPAAAFLCLLLLVSAAPAGAARPLIDLHNWDSYFALFARDSSVPWKESTVRLDTYSGAPVDLAVFSVDPADVIVAGTSAVPRTVATSRRKPIARWRYTPPSGYRFQSNEVGVPLGAREGFFVVEARRNNVALQVWINRTRIGLVSKQSAGELLVYGADLGSGRALSHMRVSFLVNGRFDVRYTDAHGLIRWRERARPIFAMADYANSKAFVSFLPQAPMPQSIAGVMVDSAVAHAGDTVRVVGFARMRSAGTFRPGSGDALVSIRHGASVIAEGRARLDPSGSFVLPLQLPAATRTADYAVLMSAGSATAGTTLHVDANENGLMLSVRSDCPAACDPNADVPIRVRATRGAGVVAGVRIQLEVVRSPHVYVGSAIRSSDWGTTTVVQQEVVTGIDGAATLSIAHPTDELSSTYGIRAIAEGATAATQVVVATAPVSLRLQLDRTQQSLGNPVGFEVTANAVANAKPVPHLAVRVRMLHGTSAQEQLLTLDDTGHARGFFSSPELGSNLILARASAGNADALDAQELSVVPQSQGEAGSSRSDDVTIALDRGVYHASDRIGVSANSTGATGDALITYETPFGTDETVAPVRDGRANATFAARNAAGSLRIGAAFVHDGRLRWNTIPIFMQGAGRPQVASLRLDAEAFAPGATAHLQIDEGNGANRTLIVRMTSGIPSGSARFDGAPELLSVGEAASQVSAALNAGWHDAVAATAARASILSFDRGTAGAPPDVTLAEADTRALYWHAGRAEAGGVSIPLPTTAGQYTISVLEFGDDGHIAASSTSVTVR